jgi:hypothetical protein
LSLTGASSNHDHEEGEDDGDQYVQSLDKSEMEFSNAFDLSYNSGNLSTSNINGNHGNSGGSKKQNELKERFHLLTKLKTLVPVVKVR